MKNQNKKNMIRTWYKDERELREVKIPRYLRDLIQYSGLVECGSVEEIINFRLSDKNEELRRKISYGTNGGY